MGQPSWQGNLRKTCIALLVGFLLLTMVGPRFASVRPYIRALPSWSQIAIPIMLYVGVFGARSRLFVHPIMARAWLTPPRFEYPALCSSSRASSSSVI